MNGIEIFKNEKFGEIRVAGTSEQPLFCLADICRVLEIKNVSDCKSKLKPDGVVLTEGVSKTTNQYGTTTEQKVKLTFVNEQNLYKVIMRSDKPQAEPFQDWVCGEILPAIRKTGGYMIAKENETPEEITARALLIAKDTIKRKDERIKRLEYANTQANKEIAYLKPKAELMEKVLDADERIDIGQSAKILNLPFGRNTLFQKLRDMGIFFKNKNEPKQEYVQRGYFILKEKWINWNDHDGFVVLKVLVTQKGLEFLAGLFKVVRQSDKTLETI